MNENKKKSTIISILNVVVPFAGPILFEISNNVTGDWVDASGNFYLSAGKLVTALIGLAYIIIMGVLLRYEHKKKKDVTELQNEIENLTKTKKAYEKSFETMCALLDYLREKIKNQIDYFKDHNRIDVRDLNINSASANICKIIYQNIIENNGDDIKVTVNMYSKIKKDGADYSVMIAHEGYVSQPDAFGVERQLILGKSNIRYCDSVLMSNSPDYRILLNKKDVAKAFGMTPGKCKYNQYMGIPIRQKGGINIALIEIVLHEDSSVWENKDDATGFAANYCEILKEYVLLVDKLFDQGEIIAKKIDEGVL